MVTVAGGDGSRSGRPADRIPYRLISTGLKVLGLEGAGGAYPRSPGSQPYGLGVGEPCVFRPAKAVELC